MASKFRKICGTPHGSFFLYEFFFCKKAMSFCFTRNILRESLSMASIEYVLFTKDCDNRIFLNELTVKTDND